MTTPSLVFLILAVVGAGISTFYRSKSGIKQVLRHGAQQGWEMLIIDSFLRSNPDRRGRGYRVRFRDRDGTLVEGILEPRLFEDFGLTRSKRISKNQERGMFDLTVPMDCRKCGCTVPAGVQQCTYCHSRRDELLIA